MLSSEILYFDLTTLLKVLLTAFIVGVAAVRVVRDTASKHLTVGRFGGGADSDAYRPEVSRYTMAADEVVEEVCHVCRSPTSKKCARCKAVRYCSPSCQKQDWNAGHNIKCKTTVAQNDRSLKNAKNKSTIRTGFLSSADSVLPARATCKVLRQPRKVLFPYNEFVELFNWDKPGLPPCGLLNCGNSCFANVILQCLASTRPLVAYLVEKDHSKECSRNDWCFLCELQTHIHRLRQSSNPFSPINILSRIPNIGGNLGYWQQEDAHEFMRFAIDTMQSVCLDEFGGEKVVEPSSQETTLIHHIFGGRLQSQVVCSRCDKVSNRYENMMDLTVEIQGDAESLEECLQHFTVKEWLDGENMYKCEGCSAYVKAWKRLTVHQAPNILTIALKRFQVIYTFVFLLIKRFLIGDYFCDLSCCQFQSGRFGKLNKRVTFPETLDLGPYMSEAGESTDIYKLYAVVVHIDMLNASFFGHYICYTKDIQGTWYRIDDCKVMKVELDEVLSQRAYMLLYSRAHVRPATHEPLERLNNDNEQPVQTEEIQKTAESANVNVIRSEPATSSGSSESDLNRKPDILNQGEELEFEVNHASGKKDPIKESFSLTASNMVDSCNCSPASGNGSVTLPPENLPTVISFDESSSMLEASVSRNEEADSSADIHVHFESEKGTVSNHKLDSFECPNGSSSADSMFSKHSNDTLPDCGPPKDCCLSVDGVNHAAVSSPKSSTELPMDANSHPLVSVANHPFMCKKLDNGIAENGRTCSGEVKNDNPLSSLKESFGARSTGEQYVIPSMCNKVENGNIRNEDCSNEMADDSPLLSPKKGMQRPARRSKPVFAPGFLNTPARKKSLDTAR
ncbi:ubiquitin carboxyl-terminal hydrolase 18-like isoform X1 [Nymphaea colorata]|nr:ubiquitin carboxyl-terminal hydrolase 18-like isoform X1 [Nymphaea colorata]